MKTDWKTSFTHSAPRIGGHCEPNWGALSLVPEMSFVALFNGSKSSPDTVQGQGARNASPKSYLEVMPMNRSRLIIVPAVLSAIFMLSGCATPNSNVGSNQVNRAQTVQWGEVEAVSAVTIQNQNTGVGTATGAVLGGIAGSTIGGGNRAPIAGATAGAVAGGAAGNAMASSTSPGVEVVVRLESGQSVAVIQAGSPNDFRVGDRVRVSSDGVTTRVSR